MTAPTSTALTLTGGSGANGAVATQLRVLAEAWVQARVELCEPALSIDPRWVKTLLDGPASSQPLLVAVVPAYTAAGAEVQKNTNARAALTQFEKDAITLFKRYAVESPADARRILSAARDALEQKIKDNEGQTSALQETLTQLRDLIKKLPRARK
jgi:hypothetical protein